MIIYVTKETAKRYKLKMPEELSPLHKELAAPLLERCTGDKMLEWGAKIFYFNRRKCLQVVNFASKFTLFLVDINISDLSNIGNLMAKYMFKIYENDPEMTALLERFFEEDKVFLFSALKDKSIISTLNRNQMEFAEDGYGYMII